MRRFRDAVMCAVLVLVSASAWAQGTAQMTGIVKDDSGGVLPGVTVTATQTETGFTRTVVTSEAGAYTMPNLPTGPYRLEAMLQGFRAYSRTGVVLQVGGAPVIDVTMAVGGLEESVTVEAAAPLVDVKSAGLSEVVEQERIVELPLQGRQVTALLVLAGAAVNTGQVAGARNRSDSVAISVAGGLRTGVVYTLDGAMHNDPQDNLNLAFPFPDALQEFQVATGGLSAENGMHSGASVNAVTKSGTNRLSGNLFEFLRNHRFNATDPFATIGSDGKRLSDGLNRNQFGGTLGAPIVRDKLFVFGGYQGTKAHEVPASSIAWVPTAAMLAGDFTTAASPACAGGRQIALRAPYVNNRLDPSLVSPIALAIAKHLPAGTDPCGQITYTSPRSTMNGQTVVRMDYQLSTSQSFFGRYLRTTEHRDSTLAETGNVLNAQGANTSKALAENATVVGHTLVLGSSSVNSFRTTWVKAANRMNDPPTQYFDAKSVGIDIHSYVPGTASIAVTDGFSFGSGTAVKFLMDKDAYVADDQFTLVRGRHQIGLGANTAYWHFVSTDFGGSNGNLGFMGRQTGLGLADFVAGKLDRLNHGAPSTIDMSQWYLGLYTQDAWRATDCVTVNAGLRWEPYFGQELLNGAVANFSIENFRKGIKSTKFQNAPPGIMFPGDPGVEGKKGINTQWGNMSPRLGVAWDVQGNGRTAVRSSYAMNYDFPTAQYMYRPATGAPFSNRLTLTGTLPLEAPYRDYPGGQPHPVVQPPPFGAVFPAYAAFQVIDPSINSTRVQAWNVTAEQQLGGSWLASVSYLGSFTDRIWGQVQMNPGVFLGLGPCTLAGVNYPVCTTDNNLNQRRELSLENPVAAQGLGYVSRVADVGEQNYRGLKLSLSRRAASGVNISGNYTVSHCESDTVFDGGFPIYEDGYLKPEDPTFDRGNCVQNRRQVGNMSISVRTPEFENAALRVVASDWRVSGIVSGRSGSWLTVTANSDVATTGVTLQRVNQVGDDVYGAKTLTSYLNRDAFALPALGSFGNEPNGSIEGPGYWSVDAALTRLVNLTATQTVELRFEAFNVLNNFNWGDPSTVFGTTTFGRITTLAGSPRVMQFGIKYGF